MKTLLLLGAVAVPVCVAYGRAEASQTKNRFKGRGMSCPSSADLLTVIPPREAEPGEHSSTRGPVAVHGWSTATRRVRAEGAAENPTAERKRARMPAR